MTQSEEWLRGEAPLAEMLDDPIVRLLMERDGLDKQDVQSALLAASTRKADDLTGRLKVSRAF